MLNPVFSISHVREMVPAFLQVTKCLQDGIAAQVERGPREINILEWLNRTTLELVGQSGLGYSFDCLKEGYTNPYSIAVKNLLPSIFKVSVAKQFLPFLGFFVVIEIITTETFIAIVRANMNASAEDCLPDSELVAQMSTLVVTATHTTAVALCRTLLTLAHHQDAQARLHEEIHPAMDEHGELDYDALSNLSYLDAVCRETLRWYPLVITVTRTEREDIVLPFSCPVKGNDGKYMHEVLMPNNTNVVISILSSNRNPET